MAEQNVIDIVMPTFRMEPEEKERFYPSVARAIADKVLAEELGGQTYDFDDARIWSLNISDKIRANLKESMNGSRYKIVVQTTIGQLRDQGVRVASRCLWDPVTDNYASTSFINQSLYCNVLIFCLYTD